MELKWLEDFTALASTLSFSRAAEERNVTQSAFSRRIKQLEMWLGVTLISRASFPAELTKEGRCIFADGRRSDTQLLQHAICTSATEDLARPDDHLYPPCTR
jgi:DNA-binding transcriptional LysR family regulator